MIETLFLFLIPALILFLEKRVGLIKKVGAITVCYALGFCAALLGPHYDKAYCETLASVVVAVAIPVMLFGTDLLAIRRVGRKMLISFALISGTVMAVSAAAAFIGAGQGMEHTAELSGMSTGLYIGGTPNMFSVGKALLRGDFTLINSVYIADSIVGGVYFLLLVSVLRKGYARVLGSGGMPESKSSDTAMQSADPEAAHSTLCIRKSLPRVLLLLAIASACFGAGVLMEILINGNLEGSLFIILTVSVLGIALSFIKPLRTIREGDKLSQYLVLVFSLGLGMSMDISNLASVIFTCILYFGGIQLASALIHFVLCKLLKIDGGTAVITFVAAIYGPPFVIAMADSYGDRTLAPSGVICGVLGLITGNILGISVGRILMLLL